MDLYKVAGRSYELLGAAIRAAVALSASVTRAGKIVWTPNMGQAVVSC